jgi:hypothetical protein
MLIYQMGYGANWKEARNKRFGRSISPAPAGSGELALYQRLSTRFEGRAFIDTALGTGLDPEAVPCGRSRR